jgi:predicted  nucleic acid-binding Zn-ribbon protein
VGPPNFYPSFINYAGDPYKDKTGENLSFVAVVKLGALRKNIFEKKQGGIMSEHPFLRFINLVNFDQKLKSLESEKIAVENEIIALKKQEEESAHDIDTVRTRIFQLKKRVDEQELEMKVLDQKEKDKKKHLENLADYKDYQAIKLEMENVQRLQVEQEQNVLDAWNQLENTEQSLQKKTNEQVQQLETLHARMKELVSKYTDLDNECAQLIAQRTEMELNVPAEWLEKYTMMRARVTDPVIAIFYQSCGACSQMITAQDMVRARHGALVQCQTCYRLLYAPEIMEKHVP